MPAWEFSSLPKYLRDLLGQPGGVAVLNADGKVTLPSANVVESRTSLKAVDTSVFSSAYLLEDGREGLFKWVASTSIATHQADTYEAVFVAPDAAAVGAWVRVYDDGVEASWAGVVYGTGKGETIATANTAAIQSLIDLVGAEYVQGPVHFADGDIEIWGTIQLKGSVYTTLELVGSGARYAGSLKGVGTTLWHIGPDLTQQAINIAGARHAHISEMTIRGQLYDAFSAFQSAYQAGTSDDPTEEATWSALGGHSRYAPYAAITIDAFAGTKPTGGYDHIPYGQALSSGVHIYKAEICGFNTAVVQSPSDNDLQGDFLKVEDTRVVHVMYMMSVGNSQSRNVQASSITFNNIWALFTNNVHGKRQGSYGGEIREVSGSSCMNVMMFGNLAYLRGLSFRNFYAEECYRIGDVGSDVTNPYAITFEGGGYRPNFALFGRPARFLAGSTAADIVFSNFAVTVFDGVVFYEPPATRFSNCLVGPNVSSGTVSPYIAHALNGLAGGVVVDAISNRIPQGFRHVVHNVETGVPGNDLLEGDVSQNTGVRTLCSSIYTHNVIKGTSDRRRIAKPNSYPTERDRADVAHITSTDLTGTTLTIVTAAITYDYAMWAGMLPGCVIRDPDTGSVFFIRSFSGPTAGGAAAAATIVAELQNNMKGADWGGGLIEAFSETTGKLQFINTLVYLSDAKLEADITSGNAGVANVATAGAATFSNSGTSAIQVGDMSLSAIVDGSMTYATARVTAFDTSARTITFAGNAQRTKPCADLSVWIRQPPTNE